MPLVPWIGLGMLSMGHSLLLLQCPGSHLHPPAISAATPVLMTPEWLCGPLVVRRVSTRLQLCHRANS